MSPDEPAQFVLLISHQSHCADVIERVLTERQRPIQLVAGTTMAEVRSRLYPQEGQTPSTEPALILPALILLDPQFADGQGKRLLDEIKQEDALRHIPVIVLSSSEQPSDIWDSYQIRCNCYVVSPEDTDQLEAVVRSIEAFWLNIVTLPRK